MENFRSSFNLVRGIIWRDCSSKGCFFMKAEFYYDHRRYICSLVQVDFVKELKIKNYQGFVLAVKQGQKIGLLGKSRHNAKKVDVSQSHFYNLIKAATNALELQTRNDLILERDRMIADGEEKIQQQDREIRVLNEQLRIIAERVEHLLASQQQLTMQLAESRIADSEFSQELDDCLAPEIEAEIPEAGISQNTELLAAQLIENPPLNLEIEEVPDSEISEIDREETLLDSELEEAAENPIEVMDSAVEIPIKRLPKTASSRRMKKKS